MKLLLFCLVAALSYVAAGQGAVAEKPRHATRAGHGAKPAPDVSPAMVQKHPEGQVGEAPHAEAQDRLGPFGVHILTTPPKDLADWIAWSGNLLLVVIGVVGVGVALTTLKKIERQTKATEDSILLQETAFHQWIDVGNWKCATTYVGAEHLLLVIMEITNKTDYPITLSEGNFSFGEDPRKSIQSVEPDFFLTPETPYLISIAVYVTGEQMDQYYYGDDGCRIWIDGIMRYRGVLKRPQTQNLGGHLTCSALRGPAFEPRIPMHPET